MTPEQLKSILEHDYNRQAWIEALRDILHIQHIYSVPKPIELGKNDFDATAVELGYFDTSEGLKVGIYEVSVSPKVRLDRNKVGLRNLMRKVFQSDGDAAQIVFTHGDTWRFTYASELTVVNKETGLRERRQTDPKRYTYVFGRNQHCRTAAERFTAIKSSTDLFDTRVSLSEIEKAFSVDSLTKDFYRELSNWYFWALTKIEFPDDAEPDKDIRNSTNTIRLITRLIFVWFLKQKKLVPDVLFNREEIFPLLDRIDRSDSTYYKAILQNLFFATLNQEMGKRAFRNEKQHYNITNLYRYKKYFKEASKAMELFDNIPFLNGGLFECLDKPHPTEKTPQGNEKIIRVDGFSDRDDNKIIVPDYLFFGGATDIDLSQTYDDNRQNHLKIRGIIDILNSYNFTVEENTPLDIQVALDPELLGEVFENLLASYNPETKTTARKQTGSFYTPREIVCYMVDESLKAYLTAKLLTTMKSDECLKDLDTKNEPCIVTPENEQFIANQNELLEHKISVLLSYSDVDHGFDSKEIQHLVNAVDEVKILDPACGSGAFPMGMLQQLVHILQKIDPRNEHWKMLQMNKAQKELEATMVSADAENFAGLMKEILETFENNSNDYGRKLFLIENCIYGVDIQPIAVQIAKLRFFISLICEQDPNRELENLGIKPLPNLETKFVSANTLIGLDTSSTFKPENVYALEKQLEDVRHRHFSARTPETKRKYRERDSFLRKQIADVLKDVGFPENSANQIANWNPYDQNTYAPFFDRYWMFGNVDGFDVVIGNPPYHQLSKDTTATQEYKSYLKGRYGTSGGRLNTFIFFTHLGIELLKSNGVITYIVPNTILTQDYYKETRKHLLDKTTLTKIISYEELPFENAVVENITFFALKTAQSNYTIQHYIDDFNSIKLDSVKTKNEFNNSDTYSFNFRSNALTDKLLNDTIPLSEISNINQAIALIGDKSLSLKENNLNSKYYKLLDGRNIDRYQIQWTGVYLDYNLDRIHSCKTKEIFTTKEKLFFRRVSSRLIFAYDDEQYFALNTLVVLNLVKINEYKLKYLLGVLNSKLMDYYYGNKYKSTKTVFSEIQARSVGKLPIKKAPVSLQNKISSIVETILSAKKVNFQANTTAFERKIDEIVYKLYKLSYNEVKIIDPEFWLCAEEYQSIKLD